MLFAIKILPLTKPFGPRSLISHVSFPLATYETQMLKINVYSNSLKP